MLGVFISYVGIGLILVLVHKDVYIYALIFYLI